MQYIALPLHLSLTRWSQLGSQTLNDSTPGSRDVGFSTLSHGAGGKKTHRDQVESVGVVEGGHESQQECIVRYLAHDALFFENRVNRMLNDSARNASRLREATYS